MKKIIVFILLSLAASTVLANNKETKKNESDTLVVEKKKSKGKLIVGGYGEAIGKYGMHSNSYKRYTKPELYKDSKGFGMVDLPHVVFLLGYDFGNGWSMQTEIEYEHGGTGSAVEIEAEETGEYESEIEKGGEVALEQFWIQKSFNKAANLRMGHIILPVGLTNQYHLPTQFFTVERPEGESTIFPCTWHETGISFFGTHKDWSYEVQLVAGLDADRFSDSKWIASGSVSPYEFKMASNVAGVFRVDNRSIKGLKLGISGYCGNSAKNSLSPDKYTDIHGTVIIGTFDFTYQYKNLTMRGNFDWGHLTDNEEITKANLSHRKDSPSPKTGVASDAMCAAMELGYNILPHIYKKETDQKLLLFARYDYYDSMFMTGNVLDKTCWERHKVTAGINYFATKDIVIKAEYSSRMFRAPYNTENTISIGIAYSGLFTK